MGCNDLTATISGGGSPSGSLIIQLASHIATAAEASAYPSEAWRQAIDNNGDAIEFLADDDKAAIVVGTDTAGYAAMNSISAASVRVVFDRTSGADTDLLTIRFNKSGA